MYEGDMILTADQRMAAVMGMDVDNPFGRGSTKNTQWPGGVMPYVIDSSLCKYIAVIAVAIKRYLLSARGVGVLPIMFLRRGSARKG